MEALLLQLICIFMHTTPICFTDSCRNSYEQGYDLWRRFSLSWGYLNRQGYCTGSNTVGNPSGTCKQFPVILGETGTNFAVGTAARPSVRAW